MADIQVAEGDPGPLCLDDYGDVAHWDEHRPETGRQPSPLGPSSQGVWLVRGLDA